MKQLKKEMRRFLVAGISAVSMDLLVYYILLQSMSHSPAKTLSFLAGTVVAYIINKYWTFEKHAKSYGEMVKFSILYLTTLMANVAVNKVSLVILPEWVFFAFLAATGTSTILNFLGQKFWVFK